MAADKVADKVVKIKWHRIMMSLWLEKSHLNLALCVVYLLPNSSR